MNLAGVLRRGRWMLCFVLLLIACSAAPVFAASEGSEPSSGASSEEVAYENQEELPAPEELTLAAERAQREDEASSQALEVELASPVAEAEREASRDAYGEISVDAAQRLLADSFPEQLQELNSDPARELGELTVEKPAGAYGAVVRNGEGGSALLESTIPLWTGPSGEREAVDLSLERSGSSFTPANPLTEVELPATAAGPVQLPSGVSVAALPGGSTSGAHRFGEEDLFFPNTDSSTDTLVSPVAAGVEVFEQLRSPQSPERFRFELSLPQGANLRSDGEGGAEVVGADGGSLISVPSPSAVDAQGTKVPVGLGVEGNSLVLDVAHRSENLAYPILLDPEFLTEHWESWNGGANTYALGYWHWGESNGQESGVGYEHSTGCISHCWGSGLYSRSRGSSYLYGANTWGQFVYQAPGSTAYIRRAVFGPNDGDLHNCFTAQPHGYVGIYNVYSNSYNALGVYSGGSYENSTYDTNWVGGNGTRLAVSGVGTANASSQLSCGHEFFVGGASLYLEDPEAPTLGSLSGPSHPVANSPAPITVTATDPGLGVQVLQVRTMGSDGQTKTWYAYPSNPVCTGLTEAPCPTTWSNISVPYDPSLMPEGNDTLSITAADPLGTPSHVSATTNVAVTVDRTAPDTTIDSGPANNSAIAGTTATFTYHSSEGSSTFECKLDAASFSSCGSGGYTTPSLAEGSHSFSVRAVDAAGNTDASAASRTFYVGAPDTVIDSGPSGLTNNNAPSFTYHATQPGATFACTIDGSAYSSCSGEGFTTPTLADGPHTFSVKASSSAGIADATPASRSFTVDATPPTLTITGGPSGPTNSTTPTFTFAAESGASVKCSIDTGTSSFGACTTATSDTPSTALAQQSYTFRVRATDAAGNQTTKTSSFTVDTTPPETTIESGPDGLTANSTPDFGFGSSESNPRFECRFDSAVYEFCPSDFEPAAPLPDGAHTISVRALDRAGNVDATPATQSFTVDATRPNLKVESGPSGPTNNPTPTFTFSASAEATLTCALEADSAEAEETGFGACSGPNSETPSAPLADGAYTLRVRATDAAGNVNAVARRFRVDTAAPETSVVSGPGSTTDDPLPSFGFEASESGSTFACGFDAEPLGPCSGPGPTHSPSAALADGAHTFRVQATDAAGNVDATPATRSFAVDTAAPQTTIQAAPAGTVDSSSPTFEFSASEAGGTFECSLDTAPFAPCPGGSYTPTGLAEGEHTFQVRAVNAAADADPTPAEKDFIVDTSPPAAPVATGDLRNASVPGVDLHVELRDGNAFSPSTIRSGVKSIRVYIDGQIAYADEMPCVYRLHTCPDTLTRDLQLPYQRVLGTHVFRIESTDALGHQGPSLEWTENTPEEGTISTVPPGNANCTEGVTPLPGADYNTNTGVAQGTNGPDLIIGRDNINVINGNGGCDVILGGPTAEKIHGGPGNDLIRAERSDDEVWGEEGNDQIYGGIGDDKLYGQAGNDLIDGGPGADLEKGNNGNDTLRGGQGMDQLAGNEGTDTLDYSDAVSPGYSASTPGISGISGIGGFPDSETGVFINLTGTKNTGDDGPVGAGGGKDYLYIKREEDHGLPGEASVAEPGSFERIVGSPFSDVIWGSSEAETIEAGPGADVVVGDGGADTIDGGADGDYLDGSGTATLIGGDSSIDSCVNPAGTPTACGSGHSIVPRSQEKIALGIQRPGAGGGEASAFLAGSREGDQVSAHYNASTNSVVFAAENSMVAQRFAPIGCNAVVELTVNCPLGGKELGALVLSGGGGADKLSFEPMSLQKPGSVELVGGSGADNLGGSNLEEMLTDSNNQEGGVEHLHSGEGDDELIQEDGSDEVIGGPGNDLLISSRICERDVIYGDVKGAGDTGSDNAQFHPVKEVGVFVNLMNDHLGQTNQKNHVCPYSSEPWYDQIHQINDLEGSPQPDVFEGDEHSNLLIGRGSPDVLVGRGGSDTLNAKDDAIDQNVNCGGDQGDLARVDNQTEKNTVVHKCEKVTFEGADFPTRPGTDTISALSDEQIATSLAAGVPPPVAPSSDYPLDDSSGTSVENVVEEGEDGTYEAAGVGPSTNEPGPTLDVPGAMLETAETSAVELNGSNDYINLSEEGDPTESEASGYSVEMWVKFEAPPGEKEYLFSNMESGEGTYLFRSPEGKLVFGTSSETGSPVVATTEPVKEEEWHQVVGTLDGEDINLYVDGFPYKLGYGQSVFPEETKSAESLVGANPSMTHFLQGSVDEVVTYETALPETQIYEQLAQSKAEEPETQLAPEPETVDSDGDGVPDGVDNCPTVANGAQTDTNLDGIGDACEPPDSDGDGVPDASDNCVGIYNPEQTDSNKDGIGDACANTAPKAMTTAATNVKGTTATLNGAVNPEGVSATYQIEYGKSTSYGSKVPASPSAIGAGTGDVAVSQAVSGLEPGTTYHYRVVGSNQYGSTEGADQTMTTLSLPVVTTGAATSVKANSATVEGSVNPEGSAATYQVEYGRTTSYGSKAPAKPASVGSGASPVSVSEGLSGLEAGAIYHYRVVATNEAGTRSGEDRTFTTAAPPLTATQLAGMAVTDPFNGTTNTVSSFASGWSALGWSSGTVPKGEDQTGGWHPSNAFPTVNGAYYAPIVADTGPGIAASATMATNPSNTERYFSLWLDMGSPSAASRGGYELRLTDTAANTYTVALSKWENGTRTILASQANYSFANGNSFAIVDQGSTVSAWTNTGTGYAQLLSAADSTFSGGNAGVEGSGNITRLTNFKVGSLLTPVSNMDGALKGLALTDSFGSNESPLSEGGAWSALAWDNSTSGHNTGQVSGGWGPYDAYATINGAFWQKATVPDTGSGSAVVATLTGNPTIASRYFSLWLEMPSPGSARSGYELRLTETSSNVYEVAISRWQSGERTILASKTGYSFAVKGQFALAEKAGTVSAWTDSGSEFTQILSAADTAFNRGYSGVEAAGNITRLTNFRSGPLPPF